MGVTRDFKISKEEHETSATRIDPDKAMRVLSQFVQAETNRACCMHDSWLICRPSIPVCSLRDRVLCHERMWQGERDVKSKRLAMPIDNRRVPGVPRFCCKLYGKMPVARRLRGLRNHKGGVRRANPSWRSGGPTIRSYRGRTGVH